MAGRMVGNNDNKANSVQFKVKLPTGTDLGKKKSKPYTLFKAKKLSAS
jgi:hypothetical protein